MHEMMNYFPDSAAPSPSISNDRKIMDISVNIWSFSKFQLQQLNLMRLRIQVRFGSDIIRPSSNRILYCGMLG